MANALVCSTIQVTLERALSLASDRISMIVGFKNDLASMRRSLGFINAVLTDAGERQNQNRAVQAWLECLEEVAFDAANVLDELNYEYLRHKVEPQYQHKLKTLKLSWCHKLKEFPKGMSNLISLRHLHHDNDDAEFQMPLGMGRLTYLQTLEFFNVGQEKGRQIGELGCLKNLNGKLKIRNLELVQGKEGAEEANLFEKTNLFRLQLEWAQDREGDNCDCDIDVLDGLRPHPNLEELEIWRFMGKRFPQSLMDFGGAGNLETYRPSTCKLARLAFKYCKRCRELPPLQYLTSLKELVIFNCGELTNLLGDMLKSCTSLQKLRVSRCQNLISFPLDLQQTPSLLEVDLSECPKLKTSLTPKGFGFLTNLRSLRIGPFSDDDDHENSSIYNEFDWAGLISSSSSTLRELRLCGLPHVECLPHQLQYLTSLTALYMRDFGGIEALPDWFRNFAALERLYVQSFKKLQYLPSEDAMRSLTNLTTLLVVGSPLLKEKSTPHSSGPNSQWSKVSHIPSLHIRD